MPLQFDEINTAATKRILPGVADSFFKADPLLEYLKRNRYQVWTGGPQIQENYIFRPMIGGSYTKGKSFNVSQLQTKSGLVFDPRFYYVNSSLFKEDIEVLLNTAADNVVLNKVQADLDNCALTMSAMLACAVYRHGQNLGGVNDRSEHFNGLEEALTDATTTTYSGLTFPSYGGQDRATVTPALDSPIGMQSATVTAISYSALERSYQTCVIGSEAPVMGVTTNRVLAFINENFQPQQRIDQKEPTIGYTGLKFKDATILQSQYCPGQDITQDEIDRLGAVRPVTGDIFMWLNPGPEGEKAYIKLWLAGSKQYQFGFTGYKVRQDATMLAGQVLVAGTISVRAEMRLMRILQGIVR